MFTWYLLGSIAAVAVGWFAAVLNLAGYAPVGILPLGVGIALGAILAGLGSWSQVACRKRLVVGVISLAIVTVIAEHAWLYRDFRQQWHAARAKSPHVAMFRREAPWTPDEYVAQELSQGRAALWMVDAALLTAAAVAAAYWLQRWLNPCAHLPLPTPRDPVPPTHAP